MTWGEKRSYSARCKDLFDEQKQRPNGSQVGAAVTCDTRRTRPTAGRSKNNIRRSRVCFPYLLPHHVGARQCARFYSWKNENTVEAKRPIPPDEKKKEEKNLKGADRCDCIPPHLGRNPLRASPSQDTEKTLSATNLFFESLHPAMKKEMVHLPIYNNSSLNQWYAINRDGLRPLPVLSPLRQNQPLSLSSLFRSLCFFSRILSLKQQGDGADRRRHAAPFSSARAMLTPSQNSATLNYTTVF